MGHIKRLFRKLVGAEVGYSYNIYENGEYDLFKKLYKLNFKTIFDVGCHHGEWSLIANKFFSDAEIHTFEISESNYESSKDKLNGKNFKINNFGLSNKEGIVEYKDYGLGSQGNTTIKDSVFHDVNIASTMKKTYIETGHNYCSKKKINFIDFLKIDTEGSEHLVLEGFDNILNQGNIRLIQFEYGYANGDAKFLMKDFFNFFRKKNYLVAKLRKKIKFKEWDYSFNDFKSGPNYIAIKKDDTEIKYLLENN